MRCRRAAAWLLSIPLMAVGSQLAHLFAFQLAYPNVHVRLRELLLTGHGYMVSYPDFLPLLAGVAGGIELVAFAWAVAGGLGRRHRPVPAWAFGLLPPVGFALQEFLERWLDGVSFPWQVVLEPTFRLGLLLQLPFALAAFLLARLLLRTAERVARVLRVRTERPRTAPARTRWPLSTAWSRPLAALAAAHAGRAPPLPLAG